MKKIDINLKNFSYSIMISSGGLIEDKYTFSIFKKKEKVVLITNNVLHKILSEKKISLFSKYDINLDILIIPDGENSKTFIQAEYIITQLITKCYNRNNTLLIALGGGVIGDLTGFVASIYQRGIKFIQVPTTLLSQVDASIGGKTGVNHVLGKNMIGSFWHPSSVIIDIDFLVTLPLKQLISGLAEVIKYAIIFDKLFFLWLEKNIDNLISLDKKSILYCINKCCELKSKIVEIDERDTDSRSLLNLGHTYGHAIESYTKYSSWLHGEAVSVGIAMASFASELLGFLKHNDTLRILNLLLKTGLPVKGPSSMNESNYINIMKRDKKIVSNKIRLVIPVSIGKAIINDFVSINTICLSIQKCQNYFIK
ncbi:3-dehydroquinate synthase [Buchnera aphidicola (Neophyllaphis podocarpi)]|uniref:3-dehydroquinate synthase n=1 Tax=Buchnera aphidicola TaxID=9 RepID=UPI0031B809E0